MNKTLFVEFVTKWFGPLAKRLTETINGVKEAPKYLFKQMLRKEYSADLTWKSLSANRSIVAADVVAMDSELPLKKRDSISTANGDIPKLGMKMAKSEKLISDINIMRAKGVTEAQIVAKIFEDMPKCVSGIDERLEACFLEGISTGATLVPDENNVGTGVRVDYGYKPENKFGAAIKWDANGAKPLSDINRVVAAASAKGDKIIKIMLSKAAYNKIRNSEEGKQLYAAFIGFTGPNLIVPTSEKFNEAVTDEYGFSFMVVDRSVQFEKNGKRTAVKPFAENALVFLTTEQVGSITYGTLAEETNPVAGVEYQKVDEYILVSKYSKNDPLQEFTSSQALVLPVIEGVESIYLLNTDEGLEVAPDEVEGDAAITVYDEKYNKEEVVAALNVVGVRTNATISDAKLIEKINSLSKEDQEKFKAEVDKLTPVA